MTEGQRDAGRSRETLGVVGMLATELPANELTDRVIELVAANALVRARV
jgi:hypothetical protein